MGWRTAKASGNASMPVDESGSFAEGFASTFVPMFNEAISDYTSEQREKRMLELKESLLRQRPRSSSTSSADRKDAQELRDIDALSKQLGITPNEAASLYYSHDGDASMAADTYNTEVDSGLVVQPVVPSSPVQDNVDPSPDQTDDLSATEPTPTNDGTTVDLSSVDTEIEAPTTKGVEVADTEQGLGTPQMAFEPFQVSSIGSIADDLSLLTGDEEETAEAPERIAAAIDGEIEVAEATGQTPSITYQDGLTNGATPEENRRILAAGTRIPGVYKIPEVAEITTLAEATAALEVLNGRRDYIGGADQYDANVRPMLEARVSSLTELPDLGQMMQANEVDRLQEFYENGWKMYEGRVDPEQLALHRDRAGELLNSASSYPPIPSDFGELQALRNRVSAGEFPQAPTEWLETLNTSVRTAELQQRYGDRLSVDYIASDDRSDRELMILRGVVVNALGDTHPLAVEIDLAMGIREDNPVLDIPELSEVTASNWRFKAAAAEQAGELGLAELIRSTGRAEEEADAANDRDTAQALSELRSTVSTFQTEMTETNSEARAYLGAVSSAYSMSQILETNPEILTMAGGTIPSLVTRVVGEISAAKSLLASPDAQIDAGVALRSVDAYERRIEEEFSKGNLDPAARAYAIFEAQKTRMAFQIARMQQGPQGVISNQDFDSAYRQISGTTNPATWNDMVRGLIAQDAPAIEKRIDDLANLPAVAIAREQEKLLGMSSISASIDKSTAGLEERVTDAGLQDAFTWLNSGNPVVTATAPTEAVAPAPEAANPQIEAIGRMTADQLLSTYKNPETGAWDFSGTTAEERQAIREKLESLTNGGGN